MSKTYYYTIKETGKAWDQCFQHSINAISWERFVDACYKLSKIHKAEVRGSDYKGYNSQGYYFLYKDNQ
jgi:hypothetical protein